MSQARQWPLETGEIYHIFSKSIAHFKIFNNTTEFIRMMNTVRYYQICDRPIQFARFKEDSLDGNQFLDKEKMVKILCYCLMPTHFHFILKQTSENGISTFIANVLNSYTRYFNIRHNRRGPLWEGRFKDVLVKTDEQLLHLTRYIHLNPVTAYLVDMPEKWEYSSYLEYLTARSRPICEFSEVLKISSAKYIEFIADRIAYQRDLAGIKALILE